MTTTETETLFRKVGPRYVPTTLRQRTETLSAVLIDAAAHGMVMREAIERDKPKDESNA